MTRRWMYIIGTLLPLLLNGNASESNRQRNLRDELQNLARLGYNYRYLDPETIEIEEPWTGRKSVKTLREPDEETIYHWAASNGIPVLEVNPDTVDTNRYTGWYRYWSTVPLGNGAGYPPAVGDIDHNGKAEVYGGYHDSTMFDFSSRIYEVDQGGNVSFKHEYIPRRGSSQQFTDVDKDDLMEIMFQYGDSSFFYEQDSPLSLPTAYRFAHCKYEYQGTAITNKEVVGGFDEDNSDDFVYVGTFPDTTPNGFQYYTYVAEYDTSIENFRKVWRTQLQPPPGESGLGGYDVGDYDGDGKTNFLASEIWGDVWVLENDGDNSYRVSWTDSLPFVNLYYQTSGDVDEDNMREFFVSATMSNGNWITVFEADSNDHYSPTLLLHLLSGGSLDEPTLMTHDVDGDGGPEFVILSGADLFIFKSSSDNNYVLWYYKRNNSKQSIQFYDFNGDGKQDFIITKSFGALNGNMNWLADIFLAGNLVDVPEHDSPGIPDRISLYQNYPNPFNPLTTIEFGLPRKQNVELSIYDILGNTLKILEKGERSAGRHTVTWDGSGFASGTYFCRLQTSKGVVVRKLLLLR